MSATLGADDPKPATVSPKATSAGQTDLRPHALALPNTHKPGEVDRPEMLRWVVQHPSMLPGVVVDETAATLTGTWRYSTHTPPYVGLGYIHTEKGLEQKAEALFRPNLPREGLYEVRLAHCFNVRRAENAVVTIRHAGGEVVLRINQQQEPEHAHLFRTLGTFRFLAGQEGWVKISNDGVNPAKVVIADAVQWVPVRQSTPQ